MIMNNETTLRIEIMHKSEILPGDSFIDAADWRATYHLSPAALLPEMVEKDKNNKFRRLSEYEGVSFVDGCRFSENTSSDWYLTNI